MVQWKPWGCGFDPWPQWVKDLALLWFWWRLAATAQIRPPSLGTSIYRGWGPKKDKKIKKNTRRDVRKRGRERVQGVKRAEINKGRINSPKRRKTGQWQRGSARCHGHRRNPAEYTLGSSPGILLVFPGRRWGRTWVAFPQFDSLERWASRKLPNCYWMTGSKNQLPRKHLSSQKIVHKCSWQPHS